MSKKRMDGMEQLTSREPRISGVPGVCCTHFGGRDCQAIQGHCADGCLWEDAAWKRLAAYKDMNLTPEEVKALIQLSNDPLTLEELREGEPVWVEHGNGGEWITVQWDYVERIMTAYKASLFRHEYGKAWLAYRCKLEETQI